MTAGTTSEEAINAALNQDWKRAVSLNNTIVKEDPANIDALNRLGFAYLKLGDFTHAKQLFAKVLKIDKYNQIAQNNAKKLSSAKASTRVKLTQGVISPALFLEEPGKTKIVDCVNVAQTCILSTLSYGQPVTLKPKKHSVELRDANDQYLGALPDDISFKLLKFINKGNQYSANIKSVSKSCLSIIIREIHRGARLKNQPSFITTTNYVPFVRGNGQKSENTNEEEDEEKTAGEDES